ncbi:MAG: hypothetical protein LBM61_00595 [Prevotellaceae bacterium]|jgi:hypothetical protein|nr:hypothetical protein [Prevotellaceae bacterium]
MKTRYFLILIVAACLTACSQRPTDAVQTNEAAPLSPDYAEITVPATIAPLNFTLNETFERLYVSFAGNGDTLETSGKQQIRIPLKQWHRLLEANQGGSLQVTVYARQEGVWKSYRPFRIHVSPYPIDEGIAYRLIAPGYEVYSQMGIYRRDLSNFDEKAVYENTLVYPSCVNCHTFKQADPAYHSLHIRGDYGGTILQRDGKTDVLNFKVGDLISSGVYPYWHPDGRYIAYSVNQTHQVFHSRNDKRIEVFDLKSDVIVYDTEEHKIVTTPLLMTDNFESFPSFSPDGKSLYFTCSSFREMPKDYQDVHYNLCRIDFDAATGTFGDRIDTLVYAAREQKSVSFPRPSYDGKYLMYTLSDYGNFSIWHKEADLWLLDLRTGENRPLVEVNSNDTESYHSWSSNSRWFVFSSRRGDGLYTRPYLASIDEDGHVSKPFLLPQEHTDYYLKTFYSFNVPDFINGDVEWNLDEVAERLLSKERTLPSIE